MKDLITIRKAGLKDVENMIKVSEACFGIECTFSKKEFDFTVMDEASYVLVINNTLVGICMMTINDIACITAFAISEGYRGKGYGKMLMMECLSNAISEGVDKFCLHVEVTNKPAIKLYESFGFIKVETVKEYYEQGQDAYYMIKNAEIRQDDDMLNSYNIFD